MEGQQDKKHWIRVQDILSWGDGKRNGAGLIPMEEYEKNVLEVKRVSDIVLSVNLGIEGVMMNVVSSYVPQVGSEMSKREILEPVR